MALPKTRPLTKNCKECHRRFEKPRFCSRADWTVRKFCSPGCKAAAQVGEVSPKKGKRYPHLCMPDEARFIPCRVCGKPTKYRDKAKLGMMHCGRASCRAASQTLKNRNIKQGLQRAVKRLGHWGGTWRDTPRISKEEKLLATRLKDLGFVQQHKVLTGEHSVQLPRCFWLDFAVPDLLFYVEIDGKVHRLAERAKRDKRRDCMLKTLGWSGLRIPSTDVGTRIEQVIKLIGRHLKVAKKARKAPSA